MPRAQQVNVLIGRGVPTVRRPLPVTLVKRITTARDIDSDHCRGSPFGKLLDSDRLREVAMDRSKQGRPALAPTVSDQYQAYNVWDAPTRWFHWINALAVLGLIVVGIILLNDDALGLSANGKILLKQIHVVLGYIMGLNLLWRFVWAFFGNRYARWNAILPYGSGFWGKLRAYGNAFLSGEPQEYVGHNPAARIAIAILLFLLVLQTATGAILAGTDLYWPPFGGWFAGWVAAAGIDPATVSPLAPDTIDQTAYKAMRAFRSPVVATHLYAFYLLAGVIVMHLIAVIVTEIHEGGSITSAMFTGRKFFNRPPEDR